MKKGKERIYSGHGLTIYHQNFPKKQLKKHSHKEAHLFIPLEGVIEIEVDDVIYKVSSGQMMFVGGSVDHNFQAMGESGERLILQIEKFKFKSDVSILPVNHFIKDLSLNLFIHSHEVYASSMVKLLLEVLSSSLDLEKKNVQNRLIATQEKILTARNPQIRDVLKVMEQNLEFSVNEVAKESGLSVRTLGRLTKDETGLSPNELHTYYRIQKASELIFQGHLGLTSIAYECGYNSLSQFIENFKRWTGSKPSEFKPFQ